MAAQPDGEATEVVGRGEGEGEGGVLALGGQDGETRQGFAARTAELVMGVNEEVAMSEGVVEQVKQEALVGMIGNEVFAVKPAHEQWGVGVG